MRVNRATQTVVMAFGVLLAMAGIEHGIGEILQGHTRPAGILIQSWGDSALFSILAGEPAMTVVPSYLVSGVLTLLVSGLILVWCLFSCRRNTRGLSFFFSRSCCCWSGEVSGLLLLGIIIGLAGTKLHSGFPLLKKWNTRWIVRLLARIWPFPLVVGVLCYLYLFPVSILLWGVWGIDTPGLIMGSSVLAFLMVFLSILSAYSHDALRQGETVTERNG